MNVDIINQAIGHTLQHSDESDYKDKGPPIMAEFRSAEVEKWSAPTSNVRGVEEEPVVGPPAPATITSTDLLMVMDFPTFKERPQVRYSFYIVI